MKRLEKLIEYLLYLFVFLLPWQTRWIWHQGKLNGGLWEYGTYSLYGLDILLGVILVLWLVLNWKKGSEFRILNLEFRISLLALVGISLLSIIWAQDKGLALYTSIKLLEGILLFRIVSTIKFNFTKLAITFISSAIIQASLGIWQFLSQSTFINKWLGMALQEPGTGGVSVLENATGRWLRAYGSLPHPNILAGWLVVGLLILFGLAYQLAVQRKSFWQILHPNLGVNIFIYGSCIILVNGLFFTFSREVWLAFILSLILFWIILLIKKQAAIFYKLLFTSVATLIILSIIFWPLVSTRLSGQDRLEIKSRDERTTYLEQSFQVIKKHPVLGVGMGNYTLTVHDEINPNLKSWDYQPVHNIYLLSLAELGTAGLLVFLWLIWSVIRNLKFTHSTSSERITYNLQAGNYNKIWFLTYSAISLTFLVIGFFDHYFWTLHFGTLLFWLVIGLFMHLSSEQTVDNPS